jgi:hypothetical protein
MNTVVDQVKSLKQIRICVFTLLLLNQGFPSFLFLRPPKVQLRPSTGIKDHWLKPSQVPPRGTCPTSWEPFFPPMSVAARLATNYEKVSRRGTATILLSKHISCIAIDNLLIGMELNFPQRHLKHTVGAA